MECPFLLLWKHEVVVLFSPYRTKTCVHIFRLFDLLLMDSTFLGLYQGTTVLDLCIVPSESLTSVSVTGPPVWITHPVPVMVVSKVPWSPDLLRVVSPLDLPGFWSLRRTWRTSLSHAVSKNKQANKNFGFLALLPLRCYYLEPTRWSVLPLSVLQNNLSSFIFFGLIQNGDHSRSFRMYDFCLHLRDRILIYDNLKEKKVYGSYSFN